MGKRTNNYPEYDLRETINARLFVGLWKLMKGYQWQYLGAILSLAISAGSRTGIYLMLGYYVDEILKKARFDSSLILTALGFLLLVISQALFSFISGWLAAQTAEGTTRRLRDFLFDHIQRLSYAYHAEVKTGDLLERATSDVDTIRRFFADQAIGIGRVILIFVINLIAIIRLEPRLTLVSIGIVPVILIISIFFFRNLSKAYEAYQEQEAVLTTTLQENLSGIRVVKAFDRQDYEIYKFDQNNWEKFRRGKKLNLMHALFWPISDIVCAAQLLLALYMGATMAIDGQITLGTYITYAGLIGWIIWPIRNLGRLIIDTSRGLVSYKRVAEIIKQDREPLTDGIFEPGKSVQGEIVFEHVYFEYEKNNPILEDVSFSCKSGDVIALLGSTGSGKTSLVNLLPRFYDVTSGRILLDDIDLRDYSRKYLRSQIGIVEQEPFLFSCSIKDNITYAMSKPVDDAQIEQAARFAAIHDVILDFPNGYETLVGERGVTLSGGQKQRVAIARALLMNPRILILDDSTSSVDMETEALIRQALNNLMRNRTTFIIAHRIQSIMNADQILVFDKGCIVQSGTHAQLIETEGMYRKIFEIQTRIDDALEKEIASVRL